MAGRKIEPGSGGVVGAQAAPEMEREPNKVYQDGAVPSAVQDSLRTALKRFPQTTVLGIPT